MLAAAGVGRSGPRACGPILASATGAGSWTPDCLIVPLRRALRMAFAEDVTPGFTFRRQRFVHFRRRPSLHHALNAFGIGAARFDRRAIAPVLQQ